MIVRTREQPSTNGGVPTTIMTARFAKIACSSIFECPNPSTTEDTEDTEVETSSKRILLRVLGVLRGGERNFTGRYGLGSPNAVTFVPDPMSTIWRLSLMKVIAAAPQIGEPVG